jgi:ERCC4-type nuclease
MHTDYAAAGTSRLKVVRNGQSIVRSHKIPRPIILVDTREQSPLTLRANHPNWIGDEKRVTLKTGDYSIEGMETLLALERKSLADIVNCTVVSRKRFLSCCRRLAKFQWKAILIEATYEDLKRDCAEYGVESEVHPNAVTGTLDAIEAKFGIPVIYTSTCRELATERAASWLSKHFTYWWLEKNRLGRVLIDEDHL